MKYHIDHINEISEKLLQQLSSKKILLYGEMGAGKTTLIKALVKNLGSIDAASSPTFSIVNEYIIGHEKIFHFDLYRVKNVIELMDIGFEDYLNSDHWVFIEWPEVAEGLLTESVEKITINFKNKHSRTLKLSSSNHKNQKEAINEH